MEDVIKNILINYWQPIVAVLVLILSFIIQLIKKRPIENMLHLIYFAAIDGINNIEELSKKSSLAPEAKLQGAVNYVKSVLNARYPELNLNVYYDTIVDIVEKILTTPQKKG